MYQWGTEILHGGHIDANLIIMPWLRELFSLEKEYSLRRVYDFQITSAIVTGVEPWGSQCCQNANVFRFVRLMFLSKPSPWIIGHGACASLYKCIYVFTWQTLIMWPMGEHIIGFISRTSDFPLISWVGEFWTKSRVRTKHLVALLLAYCTIHITILCALDSYYGRVELVSLNLKPSTHKNLRGTRFKET